MHHDLPSLTAFCVGFGLALNSPELKRLRRFQRAAWTYSGMKDGYLVVVAGYATVGERTSAVAVTVEDRVEFDRKEFSALTFGGQLTDADVAPIADIIRDWTAPTTKNPLTSWRMAA